jgi:superfamily I DNA/RNA helicase
VDEFQDINAGQYELVKLISGGNGDGNLFVIGDADQSIYGFRGSDPLFMENFEKDFPSAEKITLKDSFRCPHTVIAAASQSLNRDIIMSGRELDVKINIGSFETDKSEADWIASSIERIMGGVRSFSIHSNITDGNPAGEGEGFSDFAVLCRSAFMFGAVTEALRNHGIAYAITGTEPFYSREPYRQANEIIRNIYYNKPAGCDERLADEIRNAVLHKKSPADTVAFVLKFLGAGKLEAARLRDFAKRYKSFDGFLAAVQPVTGAAEQEYDFDAVSVMTIHASKGLEFRHVFIPGCEDGIIPFTLFAGKNSGVNYAEEERIFYVGATRTKYDLFLSHAQKRVFRGMELKGGISPFLERIEKNLLNSAAPALRKKAEVQLELF